MELINQIIPVAVCLICFALGFLYGKEEVNHLRGINRMLQERLNHEILNSEHNNYIASHNKFIRDIAEKKIETLENKLREYDEDVNLTEYDLFKNNIEK